MDPVIQDWNEDGKRERKLDSDAYLFLVHRSCQVLCLVGGHGVHYELVCQGR